MSIARIELSDRSVGQMAFAGRGSYRVHDQALSGFSVSVGRRTKTFLVQGDFWRNGVREFSSRITLGRHPEISARAARQKARDVLGMIARGERPPRAPEAQSAAEKPIQAYPPNVMALTLRAVWLRYRVSHLERKNRSARTIEGYRDHVERLLAEWLDWPIARLADEPDLVARRHDELTLGHGPCAANGCMRALRAIYNHALKKNKRLLPPDNPGDAVDWNPEKRRNTAMGLKDLPDWFAQLGDLESEVRREFHLFLLLSGGRPTATKAAKVEHLDLSRRILHVPRPKGGEDRAFDVPLSRQMILCLVRAIRAGRKAYPLQSTVWLFPADSGSGHIEEHKEDRAVLAKWGNDLRQTYRTLATIAGLSEIDAKLLMNHALPGVNAGYITRGKLVEDHLRAQQQAISNVILPGARSFAPALGLSQAQHVARKRMPKRAVVNEAVSDRFIRLDEVARRVGLGKTSIYGLIQERRFPAPYKPSRMASRWSEREVADWIGGLKHADSVAASNGSALSGNEVQDCGSSTGSASVARNAARSV